MNLRRDKQRPMQMPRNMFETRTEAWREAGLGSEIDAQDARRARGEFVVLAALIAGVFILFSRRQDLFPGYGTQVRIATVGLLIIIGWGLARALGRGIAPALFKRMDPGTAGTVGFVIRLITIVAVTVVALRIAGLRAETLAVGGAFTAVIVGLAAQQTIGNLFAGIVLQGARPFRVGERVRLQGGPMAGTTEGTVSSLGLFYTTLVNGADRMLIPNNVLLQLAVVPLREPSRVDLRARFDASVSPVQIQERLDKSISVPTRYPPQIELEEVDRDEVVLRITATPDHAGDGAKLAEEVLAVARGEVAATNGNGWRAA